MGKIHPKAERAHFTGNPSHREIVKPFLAGFDVTSAFWRRRGNDELVCFFLKPVTIIAELVGLERELLLGYSPHPEFQARAVKLHDQILAEERTRLDPIGSILVCDDPATQTAVANYVVTDLERAPIVALSRDDLQRIKSADDLRTLLHQQLYSRDLFALESPLRSDTTFFGRDTIVSELLDRFRSGQNSGLFGLRRIGKTSVLYALKRRAEAGLVAGGAYLDVSAPAVYRKRWWSVLQRIARNFADPLDLQRSSRSKLRALTVEYAEDTAASHFKADIQYISSLMPGNRMLLLLDEIEHVTFDVSPAGHWTSDALPFWQTLRSVHQDTQGQLGFIVAGVNPHILEADRIGTWDNPLFSTTRSFYLGPFDIDELRAMVRTVGKYMGLRVEEGLYRRLLEEYGGHPFLVRQACSHLAKGLTERPAMLTCALFEEQREAISIALEKNVRQILNVLAIWYPDEYELLRILAQGDRASFKEFAQASASFTEHVQGYGLVTDARTVPKLRIGLVRSHLAAVPVAAQLESPRAEDLEEILAEISRRRNGIEGALRRVIREGLRFAYGNRAAAKVFDALPAERKAVLQQYGYDDVWQELYFNELLPILRSEWKHFDRYLGIELPKLTRILEHINASRSDAHARNLDEEALMYLRVCFRELEACLGLGSH